MTNAERFEKHGCVFIKNFIDATTTQIVSQYFEYKICRGEWVLDEVKRDGVSKFAYYADPLVEVLLKASKDTVEDATGRSLLPTYSYSRIYQPGEELTPHVDRPACEISVTVNIATKGEVSPIYTKYGKNDSEMHILSPGDAVIYLGCDVLHWRHPLKSDQLNVQFMLHYVDKYGPNAMYEKDTRPAFGLSPATRRL